MNITDEQLPSGAKRNYKDVSWRPSVGSCEFPIKSWRNSCADGENGAGKSTFIKVITGVHPADEGEITLNGNRVEFKNPNDAKRAGIAAIYQHVTCYPDLSVTENIFMGHEKLQKGSKRILWKEVFLIW